MILHNQLSDILCEDECQMRSKASHASHLRIVSENPDLAKSTYGVLTKCPLEFFGGRGYCFGSGPRCVSDRLVGAHQIQTCGCIAMHPLDPIEFY